MDHHAAFDITDDPDITQAVIDSFESNALSTLQNVIAATCLMASKEGKLKTVAAPDKVNRQSMALGLPLVPAYTIVTLKRHFPTLHGRQASRN